MNEPKRYPFKPSIEMLKREVRRAKKRLKTGKKFLEKNAEHIRELETILYPVKPWLIEVELDSYGTCLDVRYAGEKTVLQGIFTAMRKAGYEPNRRPNKDYDATSFGTEWQRPGNDDSFSVWIQWSGTKCTRVKVGTRMVEETVYETVCE